MVLKLLQIIGQIFAFDKRVPSGVTGGGRRGERTVTP